MTTREEIAAMRRRHEQVKNAGIWVARRVSSILKGLGHPKGGRYTPWGYTAEGWLCYEIGNGTCEVPTAIASWVGRSPLGAPQDKLEEAVAAINKDARLTATVEGRKDRQNIHITRKEG